MYSKGLLLHNFNKSSVMFDSLDVPCMTVSEISYLTY